MLTDMMKDVVSSGTGTSAIIPGITVAGKTGTNDDYTSVYFAGFTGYYTASLWIGHDKYSEKLASGVCSADGIWHTGWVAHYKNWKNMPKSTVNFDGNGGVNSTMMYIEIVPRVVEDGAGFVAEQFFSYYD